MSLPETLSTTSSALLNHKDNEAQIAFIQLMTGLINFPN
jgi:hypothetical protein